MKRIEWNTCINCPWIAEDRNTCKLRYKVIVDIGNIPEWCPIPDLKGTPVSHTFWFDLFNERYPDEVSEILTNIKA